jgi:hypothetical protein
MKSFLRLTVLIALIMVLCGTMLHARGGMYGRIALDGVGQSGVTLTATLYPGTGFIAGFSPVETFTTVAGGYFTVWFTESQYSHNVFGEITISGTLQFCPHKSFDFTTPKHDYVETSIEYMDFNFLTAPSGAALQCNTCNIGIVPPW